MRTGLQLGQAVLGLLVSPGISQFYFQNEEERILIAGCSGYFRDILIIGNFRQLFGTG